MWQDEVRLCTISHLIYLRRVFNLRICISQAIRRMCDCKVEFSTELINVVRDLRNSYHFTVSTSSERIEAIEVSCDS